MLNSKKWEVKPRGKSSQSGRAKPQPGKKLERLPSGHRIPSATGGVRPPASKKINDHLSKINKILQPEDQNLNSENLWRLNEDLASDLGSKKSEISSITKGSNYTEKVFNKY